MRKFARVIAPVLLLSWVLLAVHSNVKHTRHRDATLESCQAPDFKHVHLPAVLPIPPVPVSIYETVRCPLSDRPKFQDSLHVLRSRNTRAPPCRTA